MPKCRFCGFETKWITYCESHFDHENMCRQIQDSFQKAAQEKIDQDRQSLINSLLPAVQPLVNPFSVAQPAPEPTPPQQTPQPVGASQSRKRVRQLESSIVELPNQILRRTQIQADGIQLVTEVSLNYLMTYCPSDVGFENMKKSSELSSWHFRTTSEVDRYLAMVPQLEPQIKINSADLEERKQSCLIFQDVIRSLIPKTVHPEIKNYFYAKLFKLQDIFNRDN